MGARLAVGAAERHAAAVADRLVHVQQPLHAICPASPTPGTPLASFLLGQVQQFSIDLQQEQIRNRAHFQEYFIQDDWRVSDRVTVNAGLRYTLNFPSTEENNQVGGLQPARRSSSSTWDGTASRAPRASSTSTTSARASASSDASTDKTVVRTGYGLVWIEMAGITTPFTTPVFPFLQTVSQRTLDNIIAGLRAGRRARASSPIPLTPDAGLGQGVFAVDRDLGSGYVQQWNASLQRELTPNISSKSRTSARRSPTSAFPTRT